MLAAEVADLAAADLTLTSTGALGEEIQELHVLELALRVQRLRRLEVYDAADGPADEGQLSTAGWVKSKLGVSHGMAAADVAVARVRRAMPQLGAAFEAARTSFRHLQIAAAAMRRLPEPQVWAELDEQVTGWARTTTGVEFAKMLDALVEQLRPESKPRDETRHAGRRLSVSKGFDGMLNVVGRFAGEVGEKLHQALSAASRPDADGEVRTVAQRRADAFDDLLNVALDTALLPVDGGEKPHINLTVALDQLAGGEPVPDERAGSFAGRWGETAEQRTRRLGTAAAVAEAVSTAPRMSWTGPVGVGTARRLCCDGIVLPIFTRGGQPIDVGRRTRVINAGLRAFVVARDRHCQAPGCEVPARWCQVHHVHHWRDGGQTTRTNLVLICHKHHRDAHSGRWVVVLHAPGRITFRRRLPHEAQYEIRCRQRPPSPADDTPPLHGILAPPHATSAPAEAAQPGRRPACAPGRRPIAAATRNGAHRRRGSRRRGPRARATQQERQRLR